MRLTQIYLDELERSCIFRKGMVEYKNEISRDCLNDMQEVGTTHSTEEASNARGGKGLTQN